MEYGAHVEAVTREAGALRAALVAAPSDMALPTCPDWRPRDLAVHVGLFAGFWTHVICEGTGRPKTEVADAPPDGVDRWFADLAADLSRVLDDTPPAAEVWTWSLHDRSAAFVARRAAHELAVHRVDAQVAAGSQAPVDAELAADGIEEVFMMLDQWQRRGDDRGGAALGGGDRLQLLATDTGHEWLITLGADGVAFERSEGDADLVLTGPVSDLEMLIYTRPTLGEVDQVGDPAVLDAWRRAFSFG